MSSLRLAEVCRGEIEKRVRIYAYDGSTDYSDQVDPGMSPPEIVAVETVHPECKILMKLYHWSWDVVPECGVIPEFVRLVRA